jgi:uncharacterized protein (TIRG00374 family)
MFHIVILILGCVGITIAVYQLGEDGMDRVLSTGWWFALIAAFDLAGTCCDAFAIHGFLRPRQRVSYWAVFAAQASGIAINRLTPGNSLGEPVKVTMLTGQHVPTSLAVSSIVMFNLASMYVGIAALVIGVPITAAVLDLPREVAVTVWVVTGLLVVAAALVIVIVRRGAVMTLIDAISGLRFVNRERAKRWREKIADIDARVRQMQGLGRGLAGVVGSRIFNWCGTIAVMYAADIPLSPSLVVAALSVGVIVTWIANIVPLGLGIADGANYVLYGVLGATQNAGLVFTMINRLRTVVLALMGLLVMAIAHSALRIRLARAAVPT